jgi:acyl-CoA synthetase (AMP-forming)/AMP-acid ligase II
VPFKPEIGNAQIQNTKYNMNVLGQVTSSRYCRKNVLMDGQLSCSYKEIPEVFERIERYLANWGIGREDYLALECENFLPSALVLLYLLERRYSFLLLPKVVCGAQVRKPPLPRFCRYRVVAERLTGDGSAIDLRHPEQFLGVVENEGWSGDLHRASHASPKLYLQTSGSTGNPKMAIHSHAKLMGNALNCVHRLGLEGDDRIAIPVPIFHMYGLGAAFLPAITVGASIDLQPNSNLLRYLQREKEFNPNVAFLTPIYCETLLKGRKSSRTYKLTVAAGDRLREDTFVSYESRFGCVVNLYGSTEMGAISASSPNDAREARAKTVGKPMPGVRVRVADLESEGEMKGVGELWCQHECGFEGYADESGEPDKGAQVDWFRTRDLGRICSDGCLVVLGRCDHSFNRNGLLVVLAEVERAMEMIEGIERVAVVAEGESQRGKGMAAYCLLSPDASFKDELRASCFDILPRHAIPDVVFIVRSLPMLPNGKVDRQKLIDLGDKVR